VSTDSLIAACKNNGLAEDLTARYQMLIVDATGYVKKTEQETSVLFELIAH
jgi:DNA replication protein DnaC